MNKNLINRIEKWDFHFFNYPTFYPSKISIILSIDFYKTLFCHILHYYLKLTQRFKIITIYLKVHFLIFKFHYQVDWY